jgi:hypothetical protein
MSYVDGYVQKLCDEGLGNHVVEILKDALPTPTSMPIRSQFFDLKLLVLLLLHHLHHL